MLGFDIKMGETIVVGENNIYKCRCKIRIIHIFYDCDIYSIRHGLNVLKFWLL